MYLERNEGEVKIDKRIKEKEGIVDKKNLKKRI